MAWFRSHYECAECGEGWTDEWSCMVDDDCPSCGARHVSPVDGDDLTRIIVQRGDSFVMMRSAPTAEHEPRYLEVISYADRRKADAFLNDPE
jgi:hypothetical protein